jgi:hypothetical protein
MGLLMDRVIKLLFDKEIPEIDDIKDDMTTISFTITTDNKARMKLIMDKVLDLLLNGYEDLLVAEEEFPLINNINIIKKKQIKI